MLAIIGGGASGALLAAQLSQQSPGTRISVIDPRPQVGLGIAYSTRSPRHLLNVKAGGMSAFMDAPEHFLHWVRTHHDPLATADSFIPRTVFGQYSAELFRQSGAQHIRATVTSWQPNAGPDANHDAHTPNSTTSQTSEHHAHRGTTATDARLTLSNGQTLHATKTILATGHFPPVPVPEICEEAHQTGLYQPDAWRETLPPTLRPDQTALLVGSGLAAIDVVLHLREQGHRGPIIAVSRHGLFPHHHAASTALRHPAIAPDTPASVLDYFLAFRMALEAGANQSPNQNTDRHANWRAAIDSLRPVTHGLWNQLPIEEKRRFRRHLQHRWTVLRHRMAPAVFETIQAELTSGRLSVRKAQVQRITMARGIGQITLRQAGGPVELEAGCVINCTGPDMDYARSPSPLIQGLFQHGHAVAGDMGMNLRTNPHGAVIDRHGHASTQLFALGPPRAGTLFESTAIPEIRAQAEALARTLLAPPPQPHSPAHAPAHTPAHAPQHASDHAPEHTHDRAPERDPAHNRAHPEAHSPLPSHQSLL